MLKGDSRLIYIMLQHISSIRKQRSTIKFNLSILLFKFSETPPLKLLLFNDLKNLQSLLNELLFTGLILVFKNCGLLLILFIFLIFIIVFYN